MINERIKELRKALKLSGEKFGNVIGVKRSAICDIEKGRNNLTEQSIKLICREFNVNEQWLRTGDGDMFKTVDTISLDDIDVEPLELEILKAYFSIDKDTRIKLLNHFKDSLK